MMTKSFRNFALAGLLAIAPSMAQAFDGLLVNCDPTDGVPLDVTLSPGLGCSPSVNKIGVKADVNGCVANAAAPWNDWAAVKYPTKITSAAAATITAANVSVKSKTFGSCNFGGSANSFSASGAGKFALLTAVGGDKVGKGGLFGTVGGSIASQSAVARGFVTKGDLVGAQIAIQIGIDTGAPENANVLACNLGYICPPDPGVPSEVLKLKTAASSYLKIGIAQASDCTAADNPWPCCTGAGTGPNC